MKINLIEDIENFGYNKEMTLLIDILINCQFDLFVIINSTIIFNNNHLIYIDNHTLLIITKSLNNTPQLVNYFNILLKLSNILILFPFMNLFTKAFI